VTQMTEIETVTVDFEDLRRDTRRILQLRKSKRLVIIHEGKEILVMGPWLSGEKRNPAPDWFWTKLQAPLIPIHPDEPNYEEKLLAYLRDGTTST
jgi:hypothetical protein